MMLKSEKGSQQPLQRRAALQLQSPECHGRNFYISEHSQTESSGTEFWGEQHSTSMNVAFHWNGFSRAALDKTKHTSSVLLNFIVLRHI